MATSDPDDAVDPDSRSAAHLFVVPPERQSTESDVGGAPEPDADAHDKSPTADEPSWSRTLLRVVEIGAWVATAAMAAVLLSIRFGITRPSPLLLLQGAMTLVVGGSWFVLVGALLSRRWRLGALAAFVATGQVMLSLPLVVADDVPAWVATAPGLSVFATNAYYRNTRPELVARAVLDADAEVVVVNEVTPELRSVFESLGVFDRYPLHVHTEDSGVFGEMVMTRLPATDLRLERYGTLWVPALTVAVGDVDVRVRAMHVTAPITFDDETRWREQFDAVGRTVDRCGAVRCLYVGDFNSTYWHAPFDRLLREGLTDAHASLGLGLTRSWPNRGVASALGPLIRLDHVLSGPGLAARSLADVDVPGSDHRGTRVTIAVRQQG